MKKFVAIYGAPVGAFDEMMKNPQPEQGDMGMKAWQAWMDKHQGSFVEQGAPLGKNKRVTKDGIADMRNEANGFSVVQAESHDEAAKIFLDNPQISMPGAYVDVLEWVEMPGM